MRPDEPRTFAEAKEVGLDDPDEARFWSDHLEASPEEIAEAIKKVGCNRTAVELFLGVPDPAASAGPSHPQE